MKRQKLHKTAETAPDQAEATKLKARSGIGRIRILFAERLREVIGKKSIRKFSGEIGLPATTLQLYVLGKTEPTLSTLVAIAEHAEVNYQWLMTGEGEMRSEGVYPLNMDQDALAALNIGVNQFLLKKGLELPNDKIFKIVMLAYADARRRGMKKNSEYIEELIELAAESRIDIPINNRG